MICIIKRGESFSFVGPLSVKYKHVYIKVHVRIKIIFCMTFMVMTGSDVGGNDNILIMLKFYESLGVWKIKLKRKAD